MAVTCMTTWTGKLSLTQSKTSLTQSKTSQKPSKVFHNDEQLMLLHPLTPLITDNHPHRNSLVCVSNFFKQVLQVAKWEGSVALALTHYDPASCA